MAATLALSHGGSTVNNKRNEVGVDLDRFKGSSLIASTRGKPRLQKEPVKSLPLPLKPDKQIVIKPAPDINVTGATIISSTSSIPNNELSKWAGMPLVSVTASIWAAKNAAKKQKNTQVAPPPTGKGVIPQAKLQQHPAAEIPHLVPSQRQEYHDLSRRAPSPLQFRTPPPPVSPASFSIHRFIQPPSLQNLPQHYSVYSQHHPISHTRSLDVNNLTSSHPVIPHQPLRVCHSTSEAFYMHFDPSSGSDEGSGVGSDVGLPRIIKPRKRRKKDKRNGDCVDSITSVEVDYNDNLWSGGDYNQPRLGQGCNNPWSETNCGPSWPGGYPSPPLTPPSANMEERRFSFSSASISSSEEDVIASLMTLSRISTPPPSSSSSSSALSWTSPVTPPFDSSVEYGFARRDDWRSAQSNINWSAPIMEVYSNPNFYGDLVKPNGESPLQVSSEIIASPYGHRDIEIKFFSNRQCF